ncbi:phospholipase [Microbacterium aurugineum]|uniref:aggregation-promoting factor C-terminal-like domain-containing protein n=1 Tax=Microbacterium aurugineum TaxID=2851642 RepID=UPI0020BF43BF|nr:phospholipase [Microbacterium aurugineum]MCK8477009.1 phospholipase [Microbacterium aurugineum]
MLQKTRALRRASAAASARTAIHRPLSVLGVAAAALVGITVSVGLASVPASGTVDIPSVVTSAVRSGPEPLAQITKVASATLTQAKVAVVAAETLNGEVVSSGLDLETTSSVDTSDLESDIDKLEELDVTPVLLVVPVAEEAKQETADVVAETAELRSALDAAERKRAAEEAARIAAEKAAARAAAEKQAAAALAAANTPEGAKATARQLMSSTYGWGGDQFSCLDSLWNKESGWNYQAYNPSGATGIPQALPGSKMASAGSDWQTNAATQVAWGLGYISSVYGTPCSAWAHSQAVNWY